MLCQAFFLSCGAICFPAYRFPPDVGRSHFHPVLYFRAKSRTIESGLQQTEWRIIVEQWNEQIEKRRTFAIISHPDAGKTTLTEKLLLYGGAIQQAGIV